MPVIYSNNASTSLSAGINNSTTTIPIASASGFPTIGTGEYYFGTIANTNNTKIEVVKVTAGTTSLTVTRAQGGTTAQAFSSGDNFQLRVTADTLLAATQTDVKITGGSIATAAIADDAVTAAKMAANSIDSDSYVDGSIDTAHIADNAITSAKLGVDVIVAEDIANNAITVAELANNAVTTAKILDDNVTAAKLANSINTDIATGVTGNTTANAALPKSGGAMTGAITTNSTFDGVDIATRDGVLTSTTATAAAALPKSGGAMTGAITTNSTFDGRDVAADGVLATNAMPKSGGAFTGAVTTNSTIDGRDVAADGVLATNALPKSGGAMTGAITTNSTFDGRDVATDGTKLDGIEASATADQTASQIKTLLENGIDSVHYVDASIDLAHISSQAVDEDNLYISNAGSNGQFLSKQSGNDGGLTWATVSSEDFIPNGSIMAFFQAAAPTGWTKVTSQNDKVLRVVSGNGGGTGGTWATNSGVTTNEVGAHVHSAAAHTHTSSAHTHTGASHTHGGGNFAAAAHTLTISQMPSHNHTAVFNNGPPNNNFQASYGSQGAANSARPTGSTGGGSSHSHNASGNTAATTPGAGGSTTPGATGSTTPGNSGSANAHSHTISAPQYIDVIICSKDA